MKKNNCIKPGPKPKKEDGTLDERRRVTQENKDKYSELKLHDHNSNSSNNKNTKK